MARDIAGGKHRRHDAGCRIEAELADRLAENGEHHRVFVHAKPALLFRDQQAQPAFLGHLAVQIFGKLARLVML